MASTPRPKDVCELLWTCIQVAAQLASIEVCHKPPAPATNILIVDGLLWAAQTGLFRRVCAATGSPARPNRRRAQTTQLLRRLPCVNHQTRSRQAISPPAPPPCWLPFPQACALQMELRWLRRLYVRLQTRNVALQARVQALHHTLQRACGRLHAASPVPDGAGGARHGSGAAPGPSAGGGRAAGAGGSAGEASCTPPGPNHTHGCGRKAAAACSPRPRADEREAEKEELDTTDNWRAEEWRAASSALSSLATHLLLRVEGPATPAVQSAGAAPGGGSAGCATARGRRQQPPRRPRRPRRRRPQGQQRRRRR